ncbi:MAG: type II toxin-antitoxin system PemK/MazF family toxin [Candidatus Peribacteria bacterium]|nr:MAG: type II toxin-antitoxin system PemK/MazF family toxin [Candidatus Peribacteria bacterium]
MVAPITSFNLEKKILHTDIILEPNNILKQKSIIRTNHLRDISKKRLIKKVGRVADEILQELDIQLKELFDIRT